MSEEAQSKNTGEPQAPQMSPLQNPPGHAVIQPSPWSYTVNDVNVGGDPNWVAFTYFNVAGMQTLFAPAAFMEQLGETLVATAAKAQGRIITPPQQGLIVPGR